MTIVPMENFKLKMTKTGLQIEKKSGIRSYEKGKVKRPVSTNQTEKPKQEVKSPGAGFDAEKKARLKMGGWDDSDIERMQNNQGKRISSDEGYIRV